jgi:hypothetical protein
MQVRYTAATASSPSSQVQWIGIGAVAVVLWLWARHSPFPILFVGATLAFFAIVALTGLYRSRKTRRRQRAHDGRLVLDFQDYAFLYYRAAEEPPDEISYAEILTYYVERGGEDEYDRTRTFLSIEFRKRRAIALDVRHLDLDPQRIIGFLDHKMEWVYAQAETPSEKRT